MRKFLVVIVLAVLLMVVPNLVFAGYGDKAQMDLQTRLEVSKDNINWLNYDAETNPGNQTLTVSPGDTIYFRLTTDNYGTNQALDTQFEGNFNNPSYIESIDAFNGAANDDIDLDGRPYVLDSIDNMTDTIYFHFDYIEAGDSLSRQSGLSFTQIGGISAKIGSLVPNQAVIMATVQIKNATIPEGVFLLDKLVSRAYADDQATTQVRILVYNPNAAQTSHQSTDPSADPSIYIGK